jgi:hypothetical protein
VILAAPAIYRVPSSYAVVVEMRTLCTSAIVLACVTSPASAGQQGDPSLERIRAALSAAAVEPSITIVGGPPTASWRGLSLVQPDIGRRQFIRVRVPIGDYAMKTARAVRTARHARSERRAREHVERDLQQFLKQKQ